MMRRVMVQADPSLIERARRAAQRRGVTFPQLVRDALEREIADDGSPPPLTCAGAFSSGGSARGREYTPDAWR